MNATDVQSALLSALRDDPSDHVSLLAYADWLEENDGDMERARLIRLCAGTDRLSVKAGRIIDANVERWLEPAAKQITGMVGMGAIPSPLKVERRKGRLVTVSFMRIGGGYDWAILDYGYGLCSQAAFYTLPQAAKIAAALLRAEPVSSCYLLKHLWTGCFSGHHDCRVFMGPHPEPPIRYWDRSTTAYAAFFSALTDYQGDSDNCRHYIRQSRETREEWWQRVKDAESEALTAVARKGAGVQ